RLSVGCAVRPHRRSGARGAGAARVSTVPEAGPGGVHGGVRVSPPVAVDLFRAAPVPAIRSAVGDPARVAPQTARDGRDAAGGVGAVIVNAAGCGAAMKEYGHLLRDDPDYAERAGQFAALVRDASEFLAGLGLIPPSGRIEMTVTYQDPCHLAHGQKVRVQPR